MAAFGVLWDGLGKLLLCFPLLCRSKVLAWLIS